MTIEQIIASLQGTSGDACRALGCVYEYSTGMVRVCNVMLIAQLARMVVSGEIDAAEADDAKAMILEDKGIGTYNTPLSGPVYCQNGYDELQKGTPSSIIRDARLSIAS